MKVVLIATTDLTNGRDASLLRMIKSLSEQTGILDENLILHLLIQNTKLQCFDFLDDYANFIRISSYPTRLPLSAARNALLAPILASGQLTVDTLVLFPDDDCWFETSYIAQIVSLFQTNAKLGCWFCDYGSQPEPEPAGSITGQTARVRDVVRKAASITLAVRGDVAQSVGLFDERLGIGSPNSGGEDTDYAIRAFLASPSTRVTAKKLMGHRDRSNRPSASYFDGCLIALSKHAHCRVGLAWECIRKVVVGSVLVWRGELLATALLCAVCKAILLRRATGELTPMGARSQNA